MKHVTLVALSLLALWGMIPAQANAQTAGVELRNARGDKVGSATFIQGSDGVTIAVQVSKLPPGPHGFHVHAVGKCEGPAFTSAGGHFNPAGKKHPQHAGDLPNLLVTADGNVSMMFKTDRFAVADLLDADGSALIVHANADNYANIPKDRYRPDPDEATSRRGTPGAASPAGSL